MNSHTPSLHGRNFYYALRRAGMKQAELADKLGVRPQTVYNWRHRGVSAQYAAAVAGVLDVDQQDIAELQGSPPSVEAAPGDSPRPEIPTSRLPVTREALLAAIVEAQLTSEELATIYNLVMLLRH